MFQLASTVAPMLIMIYGTSRIERDVERSGCDQVFYV